MKAITIIAALIFLSVTGVKAQTCAPVDGKCVGTCDPLFLAPEGNQQPVQAKGVYDCYIKSTNWVPDPNNPKKKIKEIVCGCSLIRTAPLGCDGEKKCEPGGTCPTLYRTAADAIAGYPGITGSCIHQGTGSGGSCACQYKY
jgi:hypothetical protein